MFEVTVVFILQALAHSDVDKSASQASSDSFYSEIVHEWFINRS